MAPFGEQTYRLKRKKEEGESSHISIKHYAANQSEQKAHMAGVKDNSVFPCANVSDYVTGSNKEGGAWHRPRYTNSSATNSGQFLSRPTSFPRAMRRSPHLFGTVSRYVGMSKFHMDIRGYKGSYDLHLGVDIRDCMNRHHLLRQPQLLLGFELECTTTSGQFNVRLIDGHGNC